MNPARIFLTGATGFIGSYVLQECLKAGYKFRGELEFVVIPDISKQEAFGKALNDVDYVLHIASPMPGKGDDFKTDYLRPAMDGTQAILSAARTSNSVKRVIITSSVLANIPLGEMMATDLHVKGMSETLEGHTSHTTFTVNSRANSFEEDDSLNIKVDPEMEFPEGMAGDGPKYQASKILAHQAARAMIEKEKPAFPVITIHPVFVLGPTLLERSAKDISGINAWFWRSLGADSAPFPPAMIDVRDVAEAHVRAIHAPVDKPMTEFLIDGQVTGWDAVADLVKKKYPQLSLNWKRPFPKGMEVDVTRAETVLGMKWRPIEDTFSDLIEQQLSYSDYSTSLAISDHIDVFPSYCILGRTRRKLDARTWATQQTFSEHRIGLSPEFVDVSQMQSNYAMENMGRRFSVDSGYSTVSSYRNLADQGDQHQSLQDSPPWISRSGGGTAFDDTKTPNLHTRAKHRAEPIRDFPRKAWTWRPDPETGMRTRMMDTFVSQASLVKRLEAYDKAVPAIQVALSRHRPSCQDIPCAARLYASILLLTLMEACVSGYKNIAHHAGALAKFQDGPFEEIEQLGLQLLDDLVQEDEVLDFPRLGLDCLHTRVIGNDEVNGPVRDSVDASERIPGAAPKFKKVVNRVGRASWEQIVRV
ncbi:hypothetical protein D0860_07480 [Hortaea werneckii]|uniref:NAD-dependent epimerase/dehydratase domain-containing protein n=1 Tax=Hortaea werneckii TaxID=91943 RepID=A0A3M7GKK7_HORWE|nr:hypothetical protein D0860_07480 [Hortaea werneckii]